MILYDCFILKLCYLSSYGAYASLGLDDLAAVIELLNCPPYLESICHEDALKLLL